MKYWKTTAISLFALVFAVLKAEAQTSLSATLPDRPVVKKASKTSGSQAPTVKLKSAAKGGAPAEAPAKVGMSLEDFLVQVMEKNRTVQAFGASKEAADLKQDAGDLELSPTLFMQASYLDDKKIGGMPPSLLTTHNQNRQYSLGVGKKFTTGTKLQVSANAMTLNQESLILPATSRNDEFGVGTLGVSLEQSLWKDGFGSGIRLRQQRELLVSRLERDNYDLQLKQTLVQAEAVYWDYLYLEDELAQRTTSLERARKIEGWVRNRVGNGIGDRADLLNAQGLTAARELQLISTQDELIAAMKRLRDVLELGAEEKTPALSGDISKARGIKGYVSGQGEKVVRLDSILSFYEARVRQLGSEEAEEALRPDLVLSGSYNTNAFENSMAEAMKKWSENDKPTAYVALKLTWLLDGSVKGNIRNSAKMNAKASKLRYERSLLEGESSWSELSRRYEELSRKVVAAEKMSSIQTQKAAAERDKLSKGRTITSQVILAEQDAAEAELSLAKMKTEQRKLESQGRLFIRWEEMGSL